MWVRHEYGPEGAAYVRTQLEWNAGSKPLGEQLGKRDLEGGRTWAFVPDEWPPATRVDFERGPDLPHGDPAADWAADLTRRAGLFCFEKPHASRTDPWLERARAGSAYFFCEDHVYGFARAADPLERFEDALGESLNYPTVAMVTSSPRALSDRDPVSRHELAGMAAAAKAIVVAAWDATGFVICEPR